MSIPLTLHPDRLFASDPRQRELARALYDTVKNLPIVSPQRQAQRLPAARQRKLGRRGKRHAWRGPRESSAIVAGRTGLAVASIRAATGPSAASAASAVMAPAMAVGCDIRPRFYTIARLTVPATRSPLLIEHLVCLDHTRAPRKSAAA